MSDYGWSDDKGAPMGVVSPEGRSGGGGSGGGSSGGRMALLVVVGIVAIISLVVAGYSMKLLNDAETKQEATVTKLKKDYDDRIKTLSDELTAAKLTDDTYRRYAEQLKADNDELARVGRPKFEKQPEPPAQQQWVEYLRDNNTRLRRGRQPVATTTLRDPWPPRRTP